MRIIERTKTDSHEDHEDSGRLSTEVRTDHREREVPLRERRPVREFEAPPSARHYVRWLGLLGVLLLTTIGVVVYSQAGETESSGPWTAESRGLVAVTVEAPWTAEGRGLTVASPVVAAPWTPESRELVAVVELPWTSEGRGLTTMLEPIEQLPWTPEGRGLVLPLESPWTPEDRGLTLSAPAES